jgi:nitrogen-specific signal transduction histidine kinase
MPQGGKLMLDTADATAADYAPHPLPIGGALKVQCIDAGEGIELQHLARVTEPFMTTRNTGVGLGLTIVKKIIDRHSGRLHIDSLLGRGTTVTVLLPLKAQPHPEDALLRHLAAQEPAAAGPGALAPVTAS